MVNVAPSKEEEYLKHQILLKDLNPYKFFTYNAACTFVLDAPFYPVDVIRTRMQVQGSTLQNTSFPKYHNTWDAAKKLIKHEGTKGLFQGFLTCEFGYATSHVIYYGVYEATKQSLQPMFPDLDAKVKVFITTCIGGAAAELGSCAMWVPFDVATQRLQIQGSLEPCKYHNGYYLLQHIYKTEGVRGLYRGFGATLIRNIPSSAAWWSTYEVTKSYLHQFDVRKLLHLPPRNTQDMLVATTSCSSSDNDHGSHSRGRQVENEDPVIHCIAGVVAAATATTLTNPLDVAKTRLQTTTSHHIASHNTTFSLYNNVDKARVSRTIASFQNSIKNTHNIFSVLALTLQQEGIKALGKGLVPALLISTPYSVIAIVIYEQVKKWAVVS
eukprot:Phypoly_transcript_09691.p1 GENE.Phypoly_transcript_09691~~Phypoly_transcript_09691.p1  ORF type:complete len:383 (+),score=32.76 Phypoly_transcript_09691:112-1260(+)